MLQFLQIESEKITTLFIAVVWNQTCNISEVGL